jgi:uncharacterized membrane protein YqjE
MSGPSTPGKAPGASAGLFGAFKSTGATLVDILRTRLVLVDNELEVARRQVLRQLAWLFGALAFAAFCILMLVLLAIVLWWEQRVWVAGIFAVLFLMLSAVCYRGFKARMGAHDTVFASSLSELQKDLAELRQTVAEQGGPP